MNKGISIFARLGTTERKVVFINPRENNIQSILNQKYGGDWVFVNELCLGDVLDFNSEDVYEGFDGRKDDNYCVGALKMKEVDYKIQRYS